MTEPNEPPSDPARLMARAQAGDAAAYRQLLQWIALRVGSSPECEEDRARRLARVEAVLCRVHALRRTWRPGQPFEPWLDAVTEAALRCAPLPKTERWPSVLVRLRRRIEARPA